MFKISKKLKFMLLAGILSVSLVGCDKKDVKTTISSFENIYSSIETIKSKSTNSISIKSKDVEDLIDSIQVAEPNYSVKYNRDDYERTIPKFVSPSTGKKQGIRMQSIETSVHTKKFKNKNNLEYICPYTGEDIKNHKNIEYDHIFSLSQAHVQGAYKWSKEKKNKFAYDMSIGVPVQKTANRIKSDKGPSEYLPDINKESFCYSYLLIASKYDLTISPKDMKVIKNVLSNVKDVKEINIYK